MRYASIIDRVSGQGAEKWAVHARGQELARQGRDVIALSIGEPDVPTPERLRARARASMGAGRTGYSIGRGEPGLTAALARRYTARRGRPIVADQIMCLPGTQTVLFAVLMALVESGDEVLVGDPMYATYEGLIRAAGATVVPVPLDPAQGFRLQAADVAARITARSRLIFVNSPHNPTGSVLSHDDIAALGALAVAHDLWIVADEVYEDLIFPGTVFASPLDFPELAERTIIAGSISKSHAAPGFRSGWCVAPASFCARVLPLSELMLFGTAPFIADMTELAVAEPSEVAPGMVARFAHRAALLAQTLDGAAGLRVHVPEAGMFALVDVRATGLSGSDFAMRLVEQSYVAVMPGESFGVALGGWVRVALSQPDARISEAARRIADFARTLVRAA